MIGTTNVARGQRGDFSHTTPHGDLCSRRAAQQVDVREGYEHAIKNTKDALQNESIEVVAVDGGRAFALPREAVTFIRAQAIAEAN